jgi:hypothetical protein
MSNIGTLNEKPLHASLKAYYAREGDQFEVNVDGYVVDLVRDDQLIEIQTGNFNSIRTKLANLLTNHKIRLVYPVALEKWIVKSSLEQSEPDKRRKSPRRGRVEDLFWEMVRIPKLILEPNLILEVVLIRQEEVQHYIGKRHWRRKGWAIQEQRLVEVVDRQEFDTPADWISLLPDTLDAVFTTAELATEMGIRQPLARKIAYCYREAGLLRTTGKRGNAIVYEISHG